VGGGSRGEFRGGNWKGKTTSGRKALLDRCVFLLCCERKVPFNQKGGRILLKRSSGVHEGYEGEISKQKIYVPLASEGERRDLKGRA